MTSACLIVSLKKLTFAFSLTRFFRCVLWLNDTSYTTKVPERTNRNMLARNTLVQLLALYTNPESLNPQLHRQTTDRLTDGRRDRQHDDERRRNLAATVT